MRNRIIGYNIYIIFWSIPRHAQASSTRLLQDRVMREGHNSTRLKQRFNDNNIIISIGKHCVETLITHVWSLICAKNTTSAKATTTATSS